MIQMSEELIHLSHRLEAAYQAVKEAYEILHTATEGGIKAREALAAAEAAIVAKHADNPKELGGNEEIRKATIAELTKAERQAVKTAESAERAARFGFNMAEAEVKAARSQLRVIELSRGAPAQRDLVRV